MLTLKRVEESGTCVFCNKEKEVVAVVMDGQQAEVLLCWGDVKKHAQMQMRMRQNGKPEPKPAVAVPSANAVAAAK